MNAQTTALLDFCRDVNTARVAPEIRDLAREQTRRLIGIVKERTRASRIVTCKEAAKRLGVKYHIVQTLARSNHVWHDLRTIYSKRSKQNYRTTVVDIDEVRAFLEQRERERTRQKARQAPVEQPPADWVSIASLHVLTAININSLRNWCRAGDFTARKYLDKRRDGRAFWNWYIDPDSAVEIVATKIQERKERGGNLTRITRIPVTPLIRQIWRLEQ